VLALWIGGRATPNVGDHLFANHPELFTDARACPHRGDAFENGRKAEEVARLLADRYAYDAGDGVRSVQRYQEAKACYRAAGAESGAFRVHRAIVVLTARVNTDYAAARLNLSIALEQKRWSDALSEIRRLLLLTEHLGRHEYVEWLRKIIGKVAARASTVS
jgi:hypothetical protein